jgi:hypothetical protein
MEKRKPLTLTAENRGVKVRVSIEVLRAEKLGEDEVGALRIDLADEVLKILSTAPYLNAPMVTQKVRGL